MAYFRLSFFILCPLSQFTSILSQNYFSLAPVGMCLILVFVVMISWHVNNSVVLFSWGLWWSEILPTLSECFSWSIIFKILRPWVSVFVSYFYVIFCWSCPLPLFSSSLSQNYFYVAVIFFLWGLWWSESLPTLSDCFYWCRDSNILRP